MSDYNKGILLVGQILKPIGIKGTVKVRSFMSSPVEFIKLSKFIIYTGENTSENIEFSNLKHIEQDKFSCMIKGIEKHDVLEKYRLKNLYIDRKQLIPLDEGEYYFEDLQNLDVYDEFGLLLGKVRAVLDYGAGSFLEIRTEDNKIGTIPFNKNSVVTVDLQHSRIIVNKNYILV